MCLDLLYVSLDFVIGGLGVPWAVSCGSQPVLPQISKCKSTANCRLIEASTSAIRRKIGEEKKNTKNKHDQTFTHKHYPRTARSMLVDEALRIAITSSP